ncbi:MAG: AtpZ/AtpI family protein [Acidimicrobiales bacterium]
MEPSQRREITQSMHRSTGSYELVLSPVLLALVGLWLDHVLGWTPILVITFAVVGFLGAVIKLYFQYNAEMAEHEANGPWAARRG